MLSGAAAASASTATVVGPTAMSGNPCPPAKAAAAGGSSFLDMILTPGARFVPPGQGLAPQAKQAGERAAAAQRARDWADICRYRAADEALTGRARVVLMGDSITDFWRQGAPGLFRHGVVDRGISGQTSSQMLVRFWPDVIALHPRIVQILAGTNDIAGNTGPTSERQYEQNIEAMVELAQARHIRVLLGSIPPAVSFWWTPHPYRPAAQIRRLNGWLRRYARARGAGFVDYYAALATPAGAFRRDLSNDGVHPNRAGYRVMTALLRRALAAGQEPRSGASQDPDVSGQDSDSRS
ncbi:MAG TPA: GDSL-type esterase/lipase family protein [Acetobacteraceae bacterium]|nr:GDSL-type esterase/lipase family protein [Acetobacteraceae bacterium]